MMTFVTEAELLEGQGPGGSTTTVPFAAPDALPEFRHIEFSFDVLQERQLLMKVTYIQVYHRHQRMREYAVCGN